jgi:hypothetical protein
VDPGRSRLRPAGKSPIAQQWHIAQEKYFQENSDPGNLWTAEGIGRSRQEDDPEYNSGTMQGTGLGEETLEAPGM